MQQKYTKLGKQVMVKLSINFGKSIIHFFVFQQAFRYVNNCFTKKWHELVTSIPFQKITRVAITLRYFPLVQRERDWLSKKQITFKKNQYWQKISTPILSEKFEPIALENHEFESRQNMIKKGIFLHFRLIKIPI